jgi:hypothetical protein
LKPFSPNFKHKLRWLKNLKKILIPAIQMVLSINLKQFNAICFTILPSLNLLGIADLVGVSWSFKYLSIFIFIS